MTVNFPPILSRILALALLMMLAGAGYVLIVAPLVGRYDDARASALQLRAKLEHYRRADAVLASREQQIAAIKAHTLPEDGYLQGASDTLLALRIEGRVKSLAKATGSDIESSQILAPRHEEGMRRIGVRSQISTNVGGVLKLTYGIESAHLILFVDNIDIRAREPSRFRKETANPIEIVFDVYGYAAGRK